MFRSTSTNSLPGSSDTQSKLVQERIQNVEKYLGDLCHVFADYARKIAGLRDKGDILVSILSSYGSAENINKTLSKALIELSDTIGGVCDYRNAEVHRLEAHVVAQFAAYGQICKQVQEDMKACTAARNREINRQKQLNKLREQSPLSRQHISKAELEWQQASAESVRLGKALTDRLDRFEQQKLADLKRILGKFIEIELGQHAKALQLFSLAYNQIDQIDTEDDLEAFRNAIRVTDISGNDSATQTPNKSMFSFVRTGSTPALTSNQRAPQALPRSKSFSEQRPRPYVSFASPALKQKSLSKDSLKVEDYEEIGSSDDTDD